jgi:hypothetical protein
MRDRDAGRNEPCMSSLNLGNAEIEPPMDPTPKGRVLKLGYKLMSEEHGPNDLVRNASRAEEAGFAFAAISDHFSPWLEEQDTHR